MAISLTLSIFIWTESVKNPKVLLQKIKNEKKEINELIEQGEVEKAEEIKKDIAWKKAFDKSDGKKVCFSARAIRGSNIPRPW